MSVFLVLCKDGNITVCCICTYLSAKGSLSQSGQRAHVSRSDRPSCRVPACAALCLCQVDMSVQRQRWVRLSGNRTARASPYTDHFCLTYLIININTYCISTTIMSIALFTRLVVCQYPHDFLNNFFVHQFAVKFNYPKYTILSYCKYVNSSISSFYSFKTII